VGTGSREWGQGRK